jgi:hypothetical protein
MSARYGRYSENYTRIQISLHLKCHLPLDLDLTYVMGGEYIETLSFSFQFGLGMYLTVL